MVDRSKYDRMDDHDILVEVAVRQELHNEKLLKVDGIIDDHEKRLTTQVAVCGETRKTVFNEINRLRNSGCEVVRQPRTKKQKAGINSGIVAAILAIGYGLGRLFGWW